MVDHPHGIRATYEAGCRCLLCRSANAQYQAQFRADRAANRQRLGARVSPIEARRIIARLKLERFTDEDIKVRLGLKPDRRIRILNPAITVRKLLKLRRLYRLYLDDGSAA